MQRPLCLVAFFLLDAIPLSSPLINGAWLIMRPRKNAGFVRPTGVDADPTSDTKSPRSGGNTTSRRIVKSLKNPLACVTQLVPLDSGESSRPPHLLSRYNTASVPSEASVSEVRSELCSVAMEEQTEASTSSFFDHRRSRHGRKVSSSMSRSRASRAGQGSRARMRRSLPSGSIREVEESFLSYSDDPSFYACDSDGSSNSAVTEGSSRSISYTAISESVPSCSLTGLAENKSNATGWASRFRKPAVPAPRGESTSFGSIFGPDDIDPYNGRPHPRNAASADTAVGDAATPSGVAAVLRPHPPNRGPPTSVTGDVACNTRPPPAAAASPATTTSQNSSPITAETTARTSDATSQYTADVSTTDKTTECSSPLNNSGDQQPRVQRVKLLERVGRGTFGDVYRAEDLDSGKIIAVKEIIVPHDFTKDVEKQLAALESEIRVMRRLHHPHVVTYLGAVREDNSLRIFMEFVGGGTVGGKVESVGGLSEEKTRYYAAQLLEGLEYLHTSHILHRDLKGDNLFLTEDDQLKLGDFGQSKELADTLVTQSVQGTPSFMSPEMIACSGYSFEADVWSVGCCVIQMLTGKPPFANLDNQMAVMFAIISSKIEDQIPASASEGAKDFIRMCTKTNTKDRWTTAQLREHPWLLGKTAPPLTTPPSLTVVPPAFVSAHKKATTPPPLQAREPALPNPRPGKPPRSMLLDTAALTKADGTDEVKRVPRGSTNTSGAYHDGYDDEAGGTTSSNLSSSKGEASSPRHGAVGTKPASTVLPRLSPRSEATSNDSRHPSPHAPATSSPSGRRQHPHQRNRGATPSVTSTQTDPLVVVPSDGAAGARGSRKSPLEPTARPHRPLQSPRGGSPRHRAGAAAAEPLGKRRINPSPLTRALNTPVNQRLQGAVSPTKQRSEPRPMGSAIHRGSGVGNQTIRTTPNSSASAGRKRLPATSRGAG